MFTVTHKNKDMHMKYFISLTILVVILFSGCKKSETTNYNDLLIGTWVNQRVNDQPVLTDASFVVDFKSDKTEMYAIGFQIDENNSQWMENNAYTYTLAGDMITLTGTDLSGKTYYMEFKILALDETTLKYTVPEFSIDGVSYPDTHTYLCYKVTEDLSGQFTGVWYGHCTTPGTTDSLYHYWEYFADRTYNYYYQDESGNWIKKSDNEGRYFLYGNLLATNYSNDLISGGIGKAYECWDFGIDGNHMIWTGLRQNNVVASYEMEKVDAPPVWNRK